MRKAGIKDYRAFAKEMVQLIPDRPLSFEVFSDDFREMERQAMEIAGWGPNVYVKIPITNTKGEPAYELAGKLSHAGVQAQHHGHHDAGPGARRAPEALAEDVELHLRSSRDGSPTPGGIPCR